MMKEIANTKNTVTRRETIGLLASAGVFSLAGLKSFATDANLSVGGALSKITDPANINKPAMKTIGILGGMGPQATMDLEMRIHRVAQQLIPPAENSGYPPMIVQYYRNAPVVLTNDRVPVTPWQADPRLLDAAKNLGAVSDFILIASNGVHMFQKEIEQASGRKVISMIDTVLKEVLKRNWKKIGVLGLMSAKVYTSPLHEMGIGYETIDDINQQRLNQAIFKVMEGREDETDRAFVAELVNDFRNRKTDGIIPGCTEIPFLLGQSIHASDILNPSQLLAEAAVKYSFV